MIVDECEQLTVVFDERFLAIGQTAVQTQSIHENEPEVDCCGKLVTVNQRPGLCLLVVKNGNANILSFGKLEQ